MIIQITPGDTLQVQLTDTDGGFTIAYTDSELTVTAELPGSHIGSDGLIYREVFAGCTCGEVAGIVSPAPDDNALPGASPVDPRCPEHGKFGMRNVELASDIVSQEE